MTQRQVEGGTAQGPAVGRRHCWALLLGLILWTAGCQQRDSPAAAATIRPGPATTPARITPVEARFLLLQRLAPLHTFDGEPIAIRERPFLENFRRVHPDLYQELLRRKRIAATGDLSDAQVAAICPTARALFHIRLEQRGDGYAFWLARVVDDEPRGVRDVSGTLSASGVITIEEEGPHAPARCLPPWTRIATPTGEVKVRDLGPGRLVWTCDSHQRRVAMPVLRVSRTRVPSGHKLVRLSLEDGRAVAASPGHPLFTGRRFDLVEPGDPVDGSQVADVTLLDFGGPETYDLLPAGSTGAYWANGVLVGSTLQN